MGFYNIMLEGQQAEEYLAKKEKDFKKQEEDAKKGYQHNDYDDSHGLRVVQFKPDSYDREYNVDKYVYGQSYDGYNDADYKASHVARNPRYAETEKRQDRYAELKRKYPNATPSYKKTKDDDDLEKAKRKYERELAYAKGKADRNERKGDSSEDYYKDADAARRHYRRHHKNEACGIFESVEFLND